MQIDSNSGHGRTVRPAQAVTIICCLIDRQIYCLPNRHKSGKDFRGIWINPWTLCNPHEDQFSTSSQIRTPDFRPAAAAMSTALTPSGVCVLGSAPASKSWATTGQLPDPAAHSRGVPLSEDASTCAPAVNSKATTLQLPAISLLSWHYQSQYLACKSYHFQTSS